MLLSSRCRHNVFVVVAGRFPRIASPVIQLGDINTVMDVQGDLWTFQATVFDKETA